MISSVFSTSTKKEVSFKINLLGLLNVLSLSDLIRGSKVIQDPVTGDLTIADSVTGTQIQAIVEPPKRQERVRKAMFESLLVTAAYKASGAVEAFNLTSQSFHFALNQNTNAGVMTDYLNWLVALNLITVSDKQQLLASLPSQGFSTCLLRTSMTDAQCRTMFFDEQGNLRPEGYYLEYGRRAMMALLNDQVEPFDQYRYALLDQQWQQALDTGASPQTGASGGDYHRKSELSGHPFAINWRHVRHYVVGIGHGGRGQAVAVDDYVPGGPRSGFSQERPCLCDAARQSPEENGESRGYQQGSVRRAVGIGIALLGRGIPGRFGKIGHIGDHSHETVTGAL